MEHMKRWFACLTLLGGCSPTVENTFRVDTSGDPAAVAVLMLCGKETDLARQGDMLTVALPIICEGDGEVRVRLTSGRQVTCQVGYVTPGAMQSFSYLLHEGACILTG